MSTGKIQAIVRIDDSIFFEFNGTLELGSTGIKDGMVSWENCDIGPTIHSEYVKFFRNFAQESPITFRAFERAYQHIEGRVLRGSLIDGVYNSTLKVIM